MFVHERPPYAVFAPRASPAGEPPQQKLLPPPVSLKLPKARSPGWAGEPQVRLSLSAPPPLPPHGHEAAAERLAAAGTGIERPSR